MLILKKRAGAVGQFGPQQLAILMCSSTNELKVFSRSRKTWSNLSPISVPGQFLEVYVYSSLKSKECKQLLSSFNVSV